MTEQTKAINNLITEINKIKYKITETRLSTLTQSQTTIQAEIYAKNLKEALNIFHEGIPK